MQFDNSLGLEEYVMSDFNKIMAFQQMMPYLNKEQQEKLAATLGMNLQEIERRLVGKNKEDEFSQSPVRMFFERDRCDTSVLSLSGTS